MFAIYKREMKAYFISPLGYVFLGVFLLVSGAVFCLSTFYEMTSDLTEYFSTMLFCFIILLPLLTMKLFTEEKRARTEQLLLTAPVSITGMVLGKYLASLTMFVGTVLISCLNFIPLYVIAAEERAAASATTNPLIGPNTASIVGSVVGIILLGAAFIAIGIFISSLTENQLSAAVSTIGVIVLIVTLGLINQIGSEEEGNRLISNYVVRFVIDWISVLSRFSGFGYGLLDFSALVYYVSLSAIFLFLTVRVYEKRRWG